MKRWNRMVSFFLMSGLLMAAPLCAHEFIIKPVKMTVNRGETLPFSVLSAHVFMVSEEVEPVDTVSVTLVSETGETPVPVMANDRLLTLDGSVPVMGEGTAILSGHRKGIIWTQTTSGWKQAPKSACTGVVTSGKYEKFCKTLITSGHPDSGYARVLGQALEIVPVTDPASVSVGDEMTVKILYKGKPLATEVFATYDGFSRDPNTYAYYSKSDAKGMVRVKMSHDGTWMIRVENKQSDKTAEYDASVIRAVLVFRV